MTEEANNFRHELKNEDAVQAQKEIAERLIKEELFKFLYESKLENGTKIAVKEVAEQISNRLSIQECDEKIAEYIIQILQNKEIEYKYKIVGDYIQVSLNKQEIAQEKYQEERNKRAEEKLQTFITTAEKYASQLSQQKIEITAENLKEQFSEKEQEESSRWISLAVGAVLESQNQVDQRG